MGGAYPPTRPHHLFATPHALTGPQTNLDRAALALAGTMTVVSAALAVLVSTWWLLLTVFVGLKLLQASVTGVCPAARVFRRLGVDAGCAFR